MKQLHFYQSFTEEGFIPEYHIALDDEAANMFNRITGHKELELLSRPVAKMIEGLTTRIENEEQYKRYDRHGKLREMSLVDFIDALQTISEVDFQKMINDPDNPSEPKDFDSVVGEQTLHYEIFPSWLKVTISK